MRQGRRTGDGVAQKWASLMSLPKAVGEMDCPGTLPECRTADLGRIPPPAPPPPKPTLRASL